MGIAFLDSKNNNDLSEINNYFVYSYPVAANQTIKAGDFIIIENETAKLATTKAQGIAKDAGTAGQTIRVVLNALMGEYTDFTDTSLFNINQNATKTLVKERTPISDSFVRLSTTSYEYPAVGFTLADKTHLHTSQNMVACVLYKFTTNNRRPRAGFTGATDGSSLWNCWASSDTNLPNYGQTWRVARIKLNKDNWNTVKTKGAFGFCQQWKEDGIVLDVAGIWFYRVTDEQFNNSNFINNLGPIV